jgi:flavin-dependent dehydrogenase
VVLGFSLVANFKPVMQLQAQYDVAVVGGGLAGLSCSIRLAKMGHSVIVLEKEVYPFHKICGEYISLESWDFLKKLGLPLEEWNLPQVHTLLLSSPNGKTFRTRLPLGGFGCSRYELDHRLARLARDSGVFLAEQAKVEAVTYTDAFHIEFASPAGSQQTIRSTAVCGAFGKKSNLDVRWNRRFLYQQDKRLHNYVGIKYHIHSDWEDAVIGLHNFEDGYCGISKIEGDKFCLCYMTSAKNLKKNKQDIKQMERTILMRNPHLQKLLLEAKILPGFPIAISQINFQPKTQVENGVLMLGDAAGMITPLCGNGMSIALHTAKIASDLLHRFLQGDLTKSELEKAYKQQWRRHFSRRLRIGRLLQRFFGSNRLSNAFVLLFRVFPFLSGPVIRTTHGKPF